MQAGRWESGAWVRDCPGGHSCGSELSSGSMTSLWLRFPLYCCDKTLEGEELREARFTSARGLRGLLSQDGREGVVEQSCRQEGRGVGLHITAYQEAEGTGPEPEAGGTFQACP